MRLPTGHQTESRVRRLPLSNGRNSRKSAPSTGRLPPTPRPTQAKRPHAPIQVGAPAAASPNTPARKRVKLKASRRPMTSEAIPQNDAPKQRPRNRLSVVKRTVFESTPNSSLRPGRVSATPCSQMLSATQPKPQRAKSCHWYLPMPMSWIALLMTLDFSVQGVSCRVLSWWQGRVSQAYCRKRYRARQLQGQSRPPLAASLS